MSTPVSKVNIPYTGLGATIGDSIVVNYNFAFGIPEFATTEAYEISNPTTPLTHAIETEGFVRIYQDGSTPTDGTFVFQINVPSDGFVRSIENGNIFKEVTLKDLFTQVMITAGSVAEGRLQTIAQDLDMGNLNIINLADGVDPLDAVNKQQLDAVNASLPAFQAACEAAQLAAELAQTGAETAETNAEGWSDLAERWANEDEDVVVSGAEYSAKHYAAKSATSASEASTSEANAAASATAAAAAAASGLYNDVISKSFADSPIVPTLLEEGTLYRIDTSGGNVVVNLSALSVYGEDTKFAFVKVTHDANTVTINRGGTDTIQGGTSVTIENQWEVNALIGDSATGTWVNTIQIATIADGSVTLAKLQDIATTSILGRSTAGTGVPEVLNASTARTVLGLGSVALLNSIPTDNIDNDAVTLAKIAPLTADRLVGSDGSGNPSEITLAAALSLSTSSLALNFASQAEAEAGTATDKPMNALRVAQAIAALGGGGGGGGGETEWSYISTQTIPGGSNPTFSSVFDFSTYDEYMLVGKDISNSNTGQLLFRPDGVASSVYRYQSIGIASASGAADPATTYVLCNSSTFGTADGDFILYLKRCTDNPDVYNIESFLSYGTAAIQIGNGSYENATAPTGYQLINGQSGGTVSNGTVDLYAR